MMLYMEYLCTWCVYGVGHIFTDHYVGSKPSENISRTIFCCKESVWHICMCLRTPRAVRMRECARGNTCAETFQRGNLARPILHRRFCTIYSSIYMNSKQRNNNAKKLYNIKFPCHYAIDAKYSGKKYCNMFVYIPT